MRFIRTIGFQPLKGLDQDSAAIFPMLRKSGVIVGISRQNRAHNRRQGWLIESYL